MSNEKKYDGGPAYPVIGKIGPVSVVHNPGMTLRDHFAGLALSRSMYARPANLYEWLRWALGLTFKARYPQVKAMSHICYEAADEMLKAREQ